MRGKTESDETKAEVEDGRHGEQGPRGLAGASVLRPQPPEIARASLVPLPQSTCSTGGKWGVDGYILPWPHSRPGLECAMIQTSCLVSLARYVPSTVVSINKHSQAAAEMTIWGLVKVNCEPPHRAAQRSLEHSGDKSR